MCCFKISNEGRLKCAIFISIIFIAVEFIGGTMANSLAIYSDAAHLMADVAGFTISLVALITSKRAETTQYTYGYGRAEVLGALLSILFLWSVTLWLLYAATERAINWFQGHKNNIDGKFMFFVALFGILVNIFQACVFYEEHGTSLGHSHTANCNHHQYTAVSNMETVNPLDIEQNIDLVGSIVTNDGFKATKTNTLFQNDVRKKEVEIDMNKNERTRDVNLQAAYLHVLGDMVQSIGVAISGLIIWLKPNAEICDPICTFVFSLIVMISTVPLMRKIIVILMEGKPDQFDIAEFEHRLSSQKGVVVVERLRVWSLSSTRIALSAHIMAYQPFEAVAAAQELADELEIAEATFQVRDAAAELLCTNCNCGASYKAAGVQLLRRPPKDLYTPLLLGQTH